MCAEYNAKFSLSRIEDFFQKPLINHTGQTMFDRRVKLTTVAPIIARDPTGNYILEELTFPVVPFPNARLSGSDDQDEDNLIRIYERPTWKDAFEHKPCLVPMSSFVEPVYWGPDAGTAQSFGSEEQIFFAAGIVVRGRKPATPKAVVLLTHTASDQMLRYHHRGVDILTNSSATNWLEDMPREKRFTFAIDNRRTTDFIVTKDRNLGKGWEKRVPAALEKLHRELKYIERLKELGLPG